MGEPPPSGGRTGPLRIALLIAVVIATGVLGFGLYTRGTFDQLIGKSGRAPSSDTVTVYDGNGYSVELPIQWTRGSALGDVDADFLAPDGNRVQLTSSRDEAVATADLSDPSIRTAVLDTIIRVVQAVYPNAQVLSRTPTEVAGAAGEKLTLGGTQPITGQAFQDTAYLFVRGDRFFAIELISTAGAPDATIVSEFEQVVASFRFD